MIFTALSNGCNNSASTREHIAELFTVKFEYLIEALESVEKFYLNSYYEFRNESN